MDRGITTITLGLTLGLAMLFGGCVADGSDGGILVLKNVHPETGCTPTASETELGLGHGSLDVLLPHSYVFIAQLKSRITALSGQEDQRTITTTDAKIDITFPSSTLFSDAELANLKASGLTHFKQLFAALLLPNGGITDASFDLIPQALVEQIAAKADLTKSFRLETVATFTVEGDMSGQHVTSQSFAYPVTIGNNVSVNVVGTCPLPKSFGMPRLGYACNQTQDGTVDCCDRAGTPICPATVSAM